MPHVDSDTRVKALDSHISDDALENYHLGMIKDEVELAPLEEHLLACSWCAERAEENRGLIDAIRVALIKGGWDLEW